MHGIPHVRQVESYRIEAAELRRLRAELRPADAAPVVPRRRRLRLRTSAARPCASC